MSVIPLVRHLIACKKEPTVTGSDPNAHQILHAIRPKAPFNYPVWMPSFFLFAMVVDGRGTCAFRVEVRLVKLNDRQREVERIIGRTDTYRPNLGRHPLRVQFLSFMVPPVLLPEAGVYRVYLICNGKKIGGDLFPSR